MPSWRTAAPTRCTRCHCSRNLSYYVIFKVLVRTAARTQAPSCLNACTCQPQVAKVLVLLHNELLQGSSATLDRLRASAPASTSSSRHEKVAQSC